MTPGDSSRTTLSSAASMRVLAHPTRLRLLGLLRERGPFDFIRRLRHQYYQAHPDRNQEALFYSLLADLVDAGAVTKQEMVAEMAANHIRHDSFELIERYRGWQLFEQAA